MKKKTKLTPNVTVKNKGLSVPTAPILLIHGGFFDSKAPRGEALKWRRATAKTLHSMGIRLQRQLRRQSALELVLAGAYELEADPRFNAGLGSKLQRDGVARLSAAVMDGKEQRMSAVINIENCIHPSKVALELFKHEKTSLAGAEATRFALAHGFAPENVVTKERYQEWQEHLAGASGTIGAIALDSSGRLAACTSTGGRGFELPGRFSDSCTPAGNFASPFGAVSCTGVGEDILNAAVASTIVARLEDGLSLEQSIERMLQRHSQKCFGLIALDRHGNARVKATSGGVSFAIITQDKVLAGFSDDQSLSIPTE